MKLIVFIAAVLVGCGISQPPTPLLKLTPKGGSMEWQITVLNPLGASKTIIGLDNAVDSLDSFVLSRFGDCIEAQFKAVPRLLNVSARDVITLQSRPNSSSSWVNRWAGFVSRAGNPESPDVRSFRAVGLKQRLYEVEVETNYPNTAQEIGALVRTIIQAVITSGQLGSAVIYNSALVPITAFNVGALTARGRSVGDVLDAIASTVPGMTWGVNSSREFYFAVITGTAVIDDGTETTEIEQVDIDSDQLVTAVRWVSQDGITHKSVSSAAATYGQIIKTVGIDKAFLPYTNVGYTEVLAGVDVDQTITSVDTGRVLRIWRRLTGGAMDVERTALANYDRLAVEVKKRRDTSSGEIQAGFFMEKGIPATRIFPFTDNTSVDLAYYAKFNLAGGSSGDNVHMVLTCSHTHTWEIYAFDFQRIDRTKLDTMAETYYRVPQAEPARAIVRDFLAPQPNVQMIRRARVGDSTSSVLRSPTQPASQYVYSITRAGGVQTEVSIGQRDDPDNIAYERLVQAMSDRALIGAVQIGLP